MIGSAARRWEDNPAGLIGPRDCDPLTYSPLTRISRSLPEWKGPQINNFTVGSTPVQVAKRNVHRAIIAFATVLTIQPNSGAAIGFSPDNNQLKNDQATFWLSGVNQASGSGSGPIHGYPDREFSYETEGIKSVSEWWAKAAAGTASVTVTVTEWEYWG